MSQGDNCPSANVVKNKFDCQDAANYMSKSYQGVKKGSGESTYYPPGCFSNGSEVYFHTNVEPSFGSFLKNYNSICHNRRT